MKKLLVLSLVFSIASMSGAGLHLTINGQPNPGEITLAPSDTIELGVIADPGFSFGYGFISVSDPQGSLDNSGVVFSQQYLLAPDIGFYIPWDDPWNVGPGPISFDWLHYFRLEGGNTPPVVTLFEEVVMTGLMFHLDEPTEAIITFEGGVDGNPFELLDQIIVHQIPEPMTIGLLGIGTLLLRKRKE